MLVCAIAIGVGMFALASTNDTVADFKDGLSIQPGDKILKWECDINGDGKNEVLLCLKSDFDKAVQDHEPQPWVVYVANSTASSYSEAAGVEAEPQTVADILPDIDTNLCFIGQITELGKVGILTIRIDNPRSGPATAKIYAYTIEGDHLKYTKIGQYDPGRTPPPLFTKYLADDKRTQVQLQEISP